MASRYLLLEFDSAEAAEKLRLQIDTRTRGGARYRVIGLFAKPEPPYCGCGKEIHTRSQPSTLKRGSKFGWYVCTVCKRPAASLSALKNLMSPSDIINPQSFKYGAYNLIFWFMNISAPSHAVKE